MPKHPDAAIRRAQRVLRMVGVLHGLGHQRLRILPHMAPSGLHWRCGIMARRHFDARFGVDCRPDLAPRHGPPQHDAEVASYSSGDGSRYFGWSDAERDDAGALAARFTQRFPRIAEASAGWDYAYAGWFVRLLGLVDAGWMPYLFADGSDDIGDRYHLADHRPAAWRTEGEPHDTVDQVLPWPPPPENERR